MSAAKRPPRVDFQAVARAALAACPGLLLRWFPAGRVRGREFHIGNIRGDRGESLGINLDTGEWCDFAKPDLKGGDLVGVYAALHTLSQPDAARALAAELGMAAQRAGAADGAKVIEMPKRRKEWRPVLPVPTDAPPPPAKHPRLGLPAHVAEVRALDGALLHLIYRFEPPNMRKQIRPLTYGALDGRFGWEWRGPPTPRPLYGIPRLAARPHALVVLVEGEKKRDAGDRLIGDRAAVLSWPNGEAAVPEVDLSLLRGRDAVVWPDASEGGIKAAAAMAERLRGTLVHGSKKRDGEIVQRVQKLICFAEMQFIFNRGAITEIGLI